MGSSSAGTAEVGTESAGQWNTGYGSAGAGSRTPTTWSSSWANFSQGLQEGTPAILEAGKDTFSEGGEKSVWNNLSKALGGYTAAKTQSGRLAGTTLGWGEARDKAEKEGQAKPDYSDLLYSLALNRRR